MVIKQKRYERKKTILPATKYVKADYSNITSKVRYSGKTILLNNTIFSFCNENMFAINNNFVYSSLQVLLYIVTNKTLII